MRWDWVLFSLIGGAISIPSFVLIVWIFDKIRERRNRPWDYPINSTNKHRCRAYKCESVDNAKYGIAYMAQCQRKQGHIGGHWATGSYFTAYSPFTESILALNEIREKERFERLYGDLYSSYLRRLKVEQEAVREMTEKLQETPPWLPYLSPPLFPNPYKREKT